MFAKKSLGQNFLRSKAALDAIIEVAAPTAEDTVLEIGPGEGVLTEQLLERAGKVIAVEKDERLAEVLAQKFQKEISAGKLDIVAADILNYELRIKNYALVGNIPYYITGAILKKFLQSDYQPESMTLLVQKEVAERIIARDGKESLLSVSVKAYGEPKYVKTVKKGSFVPQPKVDSAIIHIDLTPPRFASTPLMLRGVEKRTLEAFQNHQQFEQKFFEIVRAGFGHKRKLLSKNLGIFGKEKIKEAFAKCNIAEKARAEDLKVEDWICLTKNLL